MRGKGKTPPEMSEIVMIDRVGGLANYRLLLDDARLYDLFVAAIMGEAEAAKLMRVQAESQAKARTSR